MNRQERFEFLKKHWGEIVEVSNDGKNWEDGRLEGVAYEDCHFPYQADLGDLSVETFAHVRLKK